MQELHTRLHRCKRLYDAGGSPYLEVGSVAHYALKKVVEESTARHLANAGDKSYSVFVANSKPSRPFLPTLFIHNPDDFLSRWNELELAMNPSSATIDAAPDKITTTFYTAITAFCVCYDLWQSKSRKTPGTYLEVMVGSIMGRLLPHYKRGKYIPTGTGMESVSTDIVFDSSDKKSGLAIPAKITTRERIVQAFAQQRILESLFGDRYKSVLMCVSEMQRAEDSDVNAICVPGQVRLYQAHLGRLSGIYYLDPPDRYLESNVTDILPVGNWGTFFTSALPTLVILPDTKP